MEPPPSQIEYFNVEEFGDPVPPAARMEYEAVASFVWEWCKRIFHGVVVAASASWSFLRLLFGFFVWIWADLRLYVAVVLRIHARHSVAVANYLESTPVRERARGLAGTRATRQDVHRERAFGAGSPAARVTRAVSDELTLDFHDGLDASVGGESDTSSAAYEVRYQGVARGTSSPTRGNVVNESHALVLTKRKQKGLQAITALRQMRRRKGLKV